MTVARKLAILPLASAAHTLTEQAANLAQLIARYRPDKVAVAAPRLLAPLPTAGSNAAAPAVERRAANRPFRGKKESTSRAQQPPERPGAPGAPEVWHEF
jgi:hypothetical protein